MLVDSISKSLNAATGVSEQDILQHANEMTDLHNEIKSSLKEKQYEEDYEFVRNNLKQVIKFGMDMLPNIISLAQDSENPRGFDSAGALLKIISEVNKDLLSVSKAAIPKQTGGGSFPEIGNKSTTNNTTVFVGSSEDLFARILHANNIIPDPTIEQ